MRKIITLIVLVLTVTNILYAQDKGIHFEQTLNWEQVLAKATKEHKYIFVDCYATWCGPCKEMDRATYPDETAGNYFNTNFISVKLQMDSTKSDNERISAWHTVAKQFTRDYKIGAYPTFLFFSPDGNLVHKEVGYQTPETLIALAKDAQDPDKQFFTQLKKYQDHSLNDTLVPALIAKALQIGKPKLADTIATDYLDHYLFIKATPSQLFSAINLRIIYNYTKTTKDKGYELFSRYPGKVDSSMGANHAKKLLVKVINKSEIIPLTEGKQLNLDEWKRLEKTFEQKYGQSGKVAVLQQRLYLDWYVNHDWKNLPASFQDYFKNAGPSYILHLNNICCDIFSHVDDPSVLAYAIELMSTHHDDQQSTGTYADLLYKAGKTDEALKWAIEAAAMEQASAKQQQRGVDPQYQADVEKIKKGEKNW